MFPDKQFRQFRPRVGTLALTVGVSLSGGCGVAHVDSGTGSPAPSPPSATDTSSVGTAMPPRIQWNANFGYCGEVSIISAGLHFGQYMSQYDARAVASGDAPQYLSDSQLLLGVNDVAAAKAMHLTAIPFRATENDGSKSFLTWVKGNVMAGYPVAIGVFANESLIDGSTDSDAGSAEYDHIVGVTGISSKHPFVAPAVYYDDDVITFNDNGLWTATSDSQPQNSFSFEFGTFGKTRRQANAETGPVYSLSNESDNYAIANTGVVDPNHETVPVRLTTSVNAESPAMVDGSGDRPAPAPVTLTITVSSLNPGTDYNLYRYSSMATVPDGDFNASAARAAQKWTITIPSGSTHTMTQNIMSDETAVYRAVPATAP